MTDELKAIGGMLVQTRERMDRLEGLVFILFEAHLKDTETPGVNAVRSQLEQAQAQLEQNKKASQDLRNLFFGESDSD